MLFLTPATIWLTTVLLRLSITCSPTSLATSSKKRVHARTSTWMNNTIYRKSVFDTRYSFLTVPPDRPLFWHVVANPSAVFRTLIDGKSNHGQGTWFWQWDELLLHATNFLLLQYPTRKCTINAEYLLMYPTLAAALCSLVTLSIFETEAIPRPGVEMRVA